MIDIIITPMDEFGFKICSKCERDIVPIRGMIESRKNPKTCVRYPRIVCRDCAWGDQQVTRIRKKLGVESPFPHKEWGKMLDDCDYRCAGCGKRSPLSIDHKKPVSKGGLNDIRNLQPLCFSCNSSKGARTGELSPAQALASLSRISPTQAQIEASRKNGLLGACHGTKGGRPRKHPAPIAANPQETPANPPKTEEQAPKRPMRPAPTEKPANPKETNLLPTLGSQVQSLRRF
jgi:5-methylcytosine-specific restriction endonuclease McrA